MVSSKGVAIIVGIAAIIIAVAFLNPKEIPPAIVDSPEISDSSQLTSSKNAQDNPEITDSAQLQTTQSLEDSPEITESVEIEGEDVEVTVDEEGNRQIRLKAIDVPQIKD